MNTASGPSAPKTRDADTESRILDAARRVFTRKGTSGARVQDIAAEAGVNQALVHYYFGSKDALAERVFIESAQLVGRAFLGAPIDGLSLEAMIEHLVTGYIDAVRRAPFIPAYVLSEAHQHPERADQLLRAAFGVIPADVAALMLARVQGEIDERVAAGTLRPMSPRQLMVNVMALTVFPFIAKPILDRALGLSGDTFEQFLDERRTELPRFILNALRP
ncbi:MAG: TetR family transcriptional regulator [Gemmatimonadaceae bacterium]|nr:TetR family transcriptional regulator [Gemmatimonadaceae bacterium]